MTFSAAIIHFSITLIQIIALFIFYKLPAKKKIDKKIESKIDKQELKKVSLKETFSYGSGYFITEKILELGEKEHKKCKEKEEKIRKRLEEKNGQINHLEKDFKKFLELVEKIDEQRDEVFALAKNFKEMTKNAHKLYEEVYELYLNTKIRHDKYIDGMTESVGKILESYCEVACDSCLTKLEFIMRSGWRISKIKKIN